MINYVKGDATEPIGDGIKMITHVCNDIGGWGRGFVLALSKKWTEPEANYRQWYANKDTGEKKFELGQTQLVFVDKGLYVANMVAQEGVRTVNGIPPIRYDALLECLIDLGTMAKAGSASIHMPRIGCGLAGGEWDEVEILIDQSLTLMSVPTYVYDLK